MNAVEKLAEELLALYDPREARNIARWAGEDILGKNRFEPTPNQSPVWDYACTRLLSGEPLAYVTGKSCFFGLDFEVSPAVLIPRPETEELVDWILADEKKRPTPRIIDVGTGSGCIAVTLGKKMPTAQITGIDISPAALSVAQSNARRLAPQVTFALCDFLTSPLPHPVDVIVSNPPYIAPEELHELSESVYAHEPHLALFAPPEDPQAFYRRLANEATNSLFPGGAVYMELNALRAEDTVRLFLAEGWQIELRNDLAGKPRMLKVFGAKQSRNSH
jgi:release factor glutamine methyltransferase